ncbi:MAG: hypothetical protein LUH05_08510 [Candidatus Gastranaerophilales bacterium]|nr:hypothetical protein [Candidatus Gastranaerophilales bacterium]
MSDDRLFASNNAIGRKWYYINLVILAVIAFLTHYIFTYYVIPNVLTETYVIISKITLYTAFVLYTITFLSLVERRLFDVCGRRDTSRYKTISTIIWFAVIIQLFSLFCDWKNPALPISNELISLAAIFMDLVFLCIVFFVGLFKGQISNLSYDEYRRKIKYQ